MIFGIHPSVISQKMHKICWQKRPFKINVFKDFYAFARGQWVNHLHSLSKIHISISFLTHLSCVFCIKSSIFPLPTAVYLGIRCSPRLTLWSYAITATWLHCSLIQLQNWTVHKLWCWSLIFWNYDVYIWEKWQPPSDKFPKFLKNLEHKRSLVHIISKNLTHFELWNVIWSVTDK